jgi:glutathione S-transferase
MITVHAFQTVPSFARGQVRDLRVRWALEEAGLPYQVRLVQPGENDGEAYRAIQPFGQVPVITDGDLTLFESGAIVLHVGARSEALLPRDEGARARATQWLIAALNSIEPHIMNVVAVNLFHAEEAWAKLRKPGAEAFLRNRLGAVAKSLGDKPFLDGQQFTAGDLMMASVLRILDMGEFMPETPALSAYVARCTARPAFGRALAAQLADLKDTA